MNAVAEAWNNLGFKVTVEEVQPIQNNDMLKEDDKEPTKDICDDRIVEAFHRGTFEVIAMDAGAMTADAYSMLANYAYAFSGGIYADSDNGVYESETHITGYDSEAYNAKIEEAFTSAKSRDRATKLHEAEAILMNDLPVIPVVYNQDTALASKKLGKIESNFFCNADFTKTKLSGYWKIALRDEFVKEENTKTEG